MTCRAWQQLLQQHLDGGEPAALERHLAGCPDCAAERAAIRRLLDGLALLSPPAPPAALADRLASRLCEEAKRLRRQRLLRRLVPLAGLAAAALVLIVLGARSWRPVPADPTPKAPLENVVKNRQPAPKEEPAAPLRESVAEASTAVAALTTRTANATVGETASLLPLLPAPTVEALSSAPPIEGPMEPLREASAGVSAGLAPVANSARRAVSLFFRDLPMGRTDRPTPPNKPG
jgi:hypothetical protein